MTEIWWPAVAAFCVGVFILAMGFGGVLAGGSFRSWLAAFVLGGALMVVGAYVVGLRAVAA